MTTILVNCRRNDASHPPDPNPRAATNGPRIPTHGCLYQRSRKWHLCLFGWATLMGVSIPFLYLHSPWFSVPSTATNSFVWDMPRREETNQQRISLTSTTRQPLTTRPSRKKTTGSNTTTTSTNNSTAATITRFIRTKSRDPPPLQLQPNDVFSRFSSFPTLAELQSSCPPRLEFLHIPKSGGTTIEIAAFQQANLAWGACHFHLNYDDQPWTNICPLHLYTNPPVHQWPNHSTLNDLWHYPLPWLLHNHTMTMRNIPSNPYHNVAVPVSKLHNHTNTTMTSSPTSNIIKCPPEEQPLHFFVVLRNPYTRAISEFYYKAGSTFRGNHKLLQNPLVLNRWIHKRLQEYKRRRANPLHPLGWNARSLHWIPQSEFIFDSSGRGHHQRLVHHVLLFENLTSEFAELTRHYQLPVTLEGMPPHKSGSIPASERLGPQHLNDNVRKELEDHFALDFVLGNYPLYRP